MHTYRVDTLLNVALSRRSSNTVILFESRLVRFLEGVMLILQNAYHWGCVHGQHDPLPPRNAMCVVCLSEVYTFVVLKDLPV